MVRKLMWFVIGFTAACAVGVYVVRGNWLLLLCLPFFALTGLCFAWKGRHAQVLRLIFFGCGAAFLWVWIFCGAYLTGAEKMNGQSIECTVQITDYCEVTDWGIAAEGKVELDEKTYRIRIYSAQIDVLSPGDSVEGEFKLTTTVSPDLEISYHSANGVYILGTLKELKRVVTAEKLPLDCYPAVLHSRIQQILSRAFPSDTLAFAKALLLGDRSDLDYSTLSALSVSGIRHVVAVSGLHVSILFSLMFMIFGYRRYVTPVVGGLVLILFMAITGFAPSVVRAGIMHGLMLGAMAFQKEYDPPTALSFAVLAMLAVNPMVVTSVGFQLSVGCLVGIFLFSSPIRRFILSDQCLGSPRPKTISGSIKNWIAGSVSMTLSTWITTTPLCAVYFGTVSLIGVLTNLLTLWMITLIFWGILAVCVLSVIHFPLGQWGAWIVSWPIRLVLAISKCFASIPLAAVYTKSVYIVFWLVFCYIIFAVFLLMKKKNPWLLMFSMIITLSIAIAGSWLEPRLDDYRFTMLDVGQGQSILLQNKGKTYLIDCGGDLDDAAADTAVETLLSQGITRLDGVIVTHYDRDHAGAIPLVLSRIPADWLYLPDIPDAGKNRNHLEELGGNCITWIAPESNLTLNDAPITLYTTKLRSTDNENSMCVLFQPGNCDILITGDRGVSGEKALLAFADLPDLDVLVVGHHGAKGAASLPLLTQTKPELALISLSKDNPYGHPSADVSERLALFDIKTLRTDICGTILIRG